jgi:hypothetical protein
LEIVRGRKKEPAHLSIKEEDGLFVGLAYYPKARIHCV